MAEETPAERQRIHDRVGDALAWLNAAARDDIDACNVLLEQCDPDDLFRGMTDLTLTLAKMVGNGDPHPTLEALRLLVDDYAREDTK